MFVMLTAVCLGAGCLSTAQSAPDRPDTPQLKRYQFSQVQMGVNFRILLYAPDQSTANLASQAAFAEIARLNRIMSDYDPDSELMQLCRSAGPGKPVSVSRDLFLVLDRAGDLSCRTAGAFDVTVGPLVRLWRRARRQKKLPSPLRLAEARLSVGHRFVHLDPDSATVELRKPNMRLDLGGIAKGYAADRALAVLRDHGITRALVDGSGDIAIGGAPPKAVGWIVAIERSSPNPTTPGSEDPSTSTPPLILRNCAVATSGDAYQYVEIGGIRYSHIIDPRTGLGLTDRSRVTVIAPDAITADSLASAVSVLGPKLGLKLIETVDGAAATIFRAPKGPVQSYRSARWSTLTAPHSRSSKQDAAFE